MAEERIVLTRTGFEQLQRELNVLETMQREEIAEVAEAAEDTDFGENAVFYDLVFDKDRLDARIRDLRYLLARAEVIDEDPDPNRVSPGNRVTLWDFEAKEAFEYDIRSPGEIKHGMRGISTESPVGEALLGRAVGETVEIEVPDGTVRYAIRAIALIPDDEG